MTRVSFIGLSFNCDPERIKSSLRSNMYSEDHQDGIITEFIRGDTLEGRHVYKTIDNFTTVDPRGNLIESQVEKYVYTKFVIMFDIGIVALIDQPRSLKPFYACLSRIISGGFSINPRQADVLLWSEGIRNLYSHAHDFKIVHASWSNILLSRSGKMSCEITDARDAIVNANLIPAIGNHKPDIITIESKILGVRFKLSKNRQIKIDPYDDVSMIISIAKML